MTLQGCLAERLSLWRIVQVMWKDRDGRRPGNVTDGCRRGRQCLCLYRKKKPLSDAPIARHVERGSSLQGCSACCQKFFCLLSKVLLPSAESISATCGLPAIIRQAIGDDCLWVGVFVWELGAFSYGKLVLIKKSCAHDAVLHGFGVCIYETKLNE